MGKYYDHPSEFKHMILDQIFRSNGLTGAEIEGIRTELAQTQLYRYRRQGLLRCEPVPTQGRRGRAFRYFITEQGGRKLDFFNRVERVQRANGVSWKEAIARIKKKNLKKIKNFKISS